MAQSITSTPPIICRSPSKPICLARASSTKQSNRGGFIHYLLDRDDIQKPWKQYTEHEFVQRMGDGSLPVENYKYYLIQDYLFLVGAECRDKGDLKLT